MHKTHAPGAYPYTVCGLRKTDSRKMSVKDVTCHKCLGDPGKHTKSLAALDADYYERQAVIEKAKADYEDRRARLDQSDIKVGYEPVAQAEALAKHFIADVKGSRSKRQLTKAELAKRTAKYIERLQEAKVQGEVECKK